MSNKTSKRTLLIVLASSLFVSVFAIACNNEGAGKTESTTVKDTTPVTPPAAQDTVKVDTQRTRPAVKPN